MAFRVCERTWLPCILQCSFALLSENYTAMPSCTFENPVAEAIPVQSDRTAYLKRAPDAPANGSQHQTLERISSRHGSTAERKADHEHAVAKPPTKKHAMRAAGKRRNKRFVVMRTSCMTNQHPACSPSQTLALSRAVLCWNVPRSVQKPFGRTFRWPRCQSSGGKFPIARVNAFMGNGTGNEKSAHVG